MSSEFVHLHVHTDYSLLDGACQIPLLAQLASNMKMPACAITDHGNMGGAIAFYIEMQKQGVKPIIGSEFYLSPTSRFEKNDKQPFCRGFHLILLAADLEGYKNLCRLSSRAAIEGMYYNPRIDKELLSQFSKGIICLSACLAGEIPAKILEGKTKEAKKAVDEYIQIFGRENFYIELMDNGYQEQKEVNPKLIMLAKEFDLKIVATNDVHYLKASHAKAQDLLVCISTQKRVTDEDRLKFESNQLYLRSASEMSELFSEIPEAIKNTLEINEKCNLKLPIGENHYPIFKSNSGKNNDELLKEICTNGIRKIFNFDPEKNNLSPEQEAIVKRMNYELSVISKAGYTSYFLIVWDFVRFAKDNNIPVGEGRGSGAGSLVAYLSGITGINPIRFNLLFERFLNPERVSPPDFDIDFCERRREEVIKYVRQKYGSDSVVQVATYGKMKEKMAFKDIARALGRDASEANNVTKLFPKVDKKELKSEDEDEPPIALEHIFNTVPELKKLKSDQSWVKEILDYAKVLEGLNRTRSTHAAAVIIGDQPLENMIPLTLDDKGNIITQYPAPECEKLGFLKMDFLGLSTLTIIQDTINIIREIRNIDIQIDKIPFDDKKTYDMINRGENACVFQLESAGMSSLCRKFSVKCIDDIIALIALYRPGPMEFIPDFIARKTGNAKVEYDHPLIEPIAKETYGILIYQEQVIQAVQILAGFSLGQADLLRRAISKKIVKEMDAQREKFIAGCKKVNNIDETKALEIWQKILKFADYGFNKSHSAAYAFPAYRTAYLKANFPVEFMCANLNNKINKRDEMISILNECKRMGIKIMPPDINISRINFTIDGNTIRFGLGAIKSLGEVAAASIKRTRDKDGKFKDFLDFCIRAGEGLNSRVLENLCRCGAFDSFGVKRKALVEKIPEALEIASSIRKNKEKEKNDALLFTDLSDFDDSTTTKLEFDNTEEYPEREMLANEKEILGFYVCSHPLVEYKSIIVNYSTCSVKDIPELKPGTPVRIGGIINSVEVKTSKTNKKYANIEFEDFLSSIKCYVSPDLIEKIQQGQNGVKFNLEKEKVCFINATVESSLDESRNELVICEFLEVNEVMNRYTNEIHIRIYEANIDDERLNKVQEVCQQYRGNCPLVICAITASGMNVFIEASTGINPVPDFIKNVEAILGSESIHYKIDKSASDVQAKRKQFQKFKNGIENANRNSL